MTKDWSYRPENFPEFLKGVREEKAALRERARAAEAECERLRAALEGIKEFAEANIQDIACDMQEGASWGPHISGVLDKWNAVISALEATPADSARALRNEILEEAAKKLKDMANSIPFTGFAMHPDPSRVLEEGAKTIRAMKE